MRVRVYLLTEVIASHWYKSNRPW